jgi:hypothetical protein
VEQKQNKLFRDERGEGGGEKENKYIDIKRII